MTEAHTHITLKARALQPHNETLGRRAGTQKIPIISTFFGIVIRMFYKEHEPPHFHAEHQGQLAKCNLGGEIIAGFIRSATARALIQRWARSHRRELEANWDKMKEGRPLDRIEPLE